MGRQMKTHIVTETEAQRWVLRPIAENLAANLVNATVGTEPDPRADINLFVNYALWAEVDTIRTALFTHKEPGDLGKVWDKVDAEADWRFVMSTRALGLVSGACRSVMRVWPPPAFGLERDYRLGICGREYASGRKRFNTIERLTLVSGIEVVVTGGQVPAEHMPAWYDSIDALVVLSDNEGGPLPVIEAFARHKPVIAPDVGFCWEWPVLRYRNDNELELIVRGLTRAKNPDNWGRTAEHVKAIHQRLFTWIS
jgi:hypothetical protein